MPCIITRIDKIRLLVHYSVTVLHVQNSTAFPSVSKL